MAARSRISINGRSRADIWRIMTMKAAWHMFGDMRERSAQATAKISGGKRRRHSELGAMKATMGNEIWRRVASARKHQQHNKRLQWRLSAPLAAYQRRNKISAKAAASAA